MSICVFSSISTLAKSQLNNEGDKCACVRATDSARVCVYMCGNSCGSESRVYIACFNRMHGSGGGGTRKCADLLVVAIALKLI